MKLILVQFKFSENDLSLILWCIFKYVDGPIPGKEMVFEFSPQKINTESSCRGYQYDPGLFTCYTIVTMAVWSIYKLGSSTIYIYSQEVRILQNELKVENVLFQEVQKFLTSKNVFYRHHCYTLTTLYYGITVTSILLKYFLISLIASNELFALLITWVTWWAQVIFDQLSLIRIL